MRTALLSLPRIDLKVKALTDYPPLKNDSPWEVIIMDSLWALGWCMKYKSQFETISERLHPLTDIP